MVEFVARKSTWRVVSFWWIVSCIFIIPIPILIYRIIAAQYEIITFYNDKIVLEKGLLNKSKRTIAYTGVFSVSMSQSLWQKLFNYGNVAVDLVGNNDLNTDYIKDPQKLVNYLETKVVRKENVLTYMN